ncbi:MAG: exonuclease SbcCD subunit D [Methanobacterium sp. ERen5]|nr:MAG: exonuclease SbcCD subunit D [Methanobacterium sp. ERen5]
MYKFAHIADCHLGAQKYPELKKLEIKAFKECITQCIENEVDFIVIAGDLFHSNLPDMGIVKEAVGLLKELQDNDIPVYVNYGSHDFSPNETSIIDIICESGLMKKLFNPKIIRDQIGNTKIKLKFTIDKKTNAKLAGISGRKVGIEKQYYKLLDRKTLKENDEFKIFVFHAWLEVLLPNFLSKGDALPLSCLPIGFNYYAGGHRHDSIYEENLENYENIAYPGPLFAGYPKDLEKSARGIKRGFFIVEFDKTVQNHEFHEINVADYEFLHFKAKDKTSNQLYSEILDKIEKIEVGNKIVIIKVDGKLSGGQTSDVNFYNIKKILIDKKAMHVSINHHGLLSKEFDAKMYKGGNNPIEIEKNLLEENTSNIDVLTTELRDEKGSEMAIQLIKIIKQNQKPNEKKSDYLNRISLSALSVLGLEGQINDI